MNPGKTLCLCMIVRDEAHVIERALHSVRDVIDYWVICDTGSSDSTPALIVQTLAGVPGELHATCWVDFAHNRTEAIRLAAGKADYILVLDADMVAQVHAPFKHRLTADAYEIGYAGDLDYTQPLLVADGHDWRYTGVVHEWLGAETAKHSEKLDALTILHVADGGNRAEKFARDIRLLTDALRKDPDDSRTVFYLAQSYRDIGEYARALELYQRRAAQTGWDEERWYALYQVARMRDLLEHDWLLVQQAYLAAWSARPWRLEPLYWMAARLRGAGDYALGLLYALPAGASPAYPADDRLFIDRPIYEYLFALEYGICCCALGRRDDALTAFGNILSSSRAPQWVRDSARRGQAVAMGASPETQNA